MGIFDEVKKSVGKSMKTAISRSVFDALDGTIHDQWKDIIVPFHFDESTVVSPGVLKSSNNGRGDNSKSSVGVITNGSKISVPENTAMFVFDHLGIETIVTEPGMFIYNNGLSSIFSDSRGNHSNIWGHVSEKATDILGQVGERISFGGQSSEEKRVAFVNLREIRNIKFGTRGGVVYNDAFYETDLEIFSRGNFSIKVTNPEVFIRNFLPPNTSYYSFADKNAREQLLSEFLQSFVVAITSLSKEFRISQLPSRSLEIASMIANDAYNAGTWDERFGLQLVKISIENIEFSPESKELVHQFSSNKMQMKSYDGVSNRNSDLAAQQKIADGVSKHGLGDGAGILFGMNVAQNNFSNNNTPKLSLEEQIEAVTKLKQLMDVGILSAEEFDIKKKEILGL